MLFRPITVQFYTDQILPEKEQQHFLFEAMIKTGELHYASVDKMNKVYTIREPFNSFNL